MIPKKYKTKRYVWTYKLSDYWHSIEIFKDGVLVHGIGCGTLKNGKIERDNVKDAIIYIQSRPKLRTA